MKKILFILLNKKVFMAERTKNPSSVRVESYNLKVSESVVSFYAILMMNYLITKEWTTKMFLHYKSMLKDIFVRRDENLDVARVHSSSAFPRRVIFPPESLMSRLKRIRGDNSGLFSFIPRGKSFLKLIFFKVFNFLALPSYGKCFFKTFFRAVFLFPRPARIKEIVANWAVNRSFSSSQLVSTRHRATSHFPIFNVRRLCSKFFFAISTCSYGHKFSLSIVIIISLFLCNVNSYLYCAPPTRQSTYTPNTVISSTDVTANEDAIFNYLQGGVDTISDGVIVNADISSSANIQSTKINLGSVAQDVLINSSGSLEVDGTTQLDGALTVNGNSTFSGTDTFADITATTADINGGSIDGTTIGASSAAAATITTATITTLNLGTTNQGDILYDNGTSITRLTPGTSGQFLQTQGSAANPQWANGGLKLLSTTSVSASANSGDITLEDEKVYFVTVDYGARAGSARIITIRFNSDSGASDYGWVHKHTPFSTSASETIAGDDAHSGISVMNNSLASSNGKLQFTIDTRGSPNASVVGRGIISDDPNGAGDLTFSGQYTGGAVSNFEILVNTGTWTGTVKTYEYN